jgi:hypothetical protein
MSVATLLIIIIGIATVVAIFGIVTIKDICVDFIDAKEDASMSATAIEIYRGTNVSDDREDLAERSYRISRILHGYPPE